MKAKYIICHYAMIYIPQMAAVLMTLLFFPFSDKPFVGASVGYFSFLFLLAGRALTVSHTRLSEIFF